MERRATPIRYGRAAAIFREQLAGGYMGVAQLPDGVLRAGEGAAGATSSS